MSKHKNITERKGVEELKHLVSEIGTCLFCTTLSMDQIESTRPMTVLETDDEGNLWFFSDANSNKNHEIQKESEVRLFFAHPGKNSYVVMHGDAEIIFDQAKINELWSPSAKIWFKGGKDDPSVSLIKVSPETAYYWDEEGNRMINFFKMLASVATGKDLLGGKEGEIHL
ncbi:MAG TPA: pyridoxamine 5'-phosphate oxidase family protein [Cyclobacteriaceae bacterium]